MLLHVLVRIIGALVHSKAAWDGPEQEDGKGEDGEEIASVEHLESDFLQFARQASHRVPSEMASIHILIGPQEIVRRYGDEDSATDLEHFIRTAQEGYVVLDVFHHIEEAHGRNRSLSQPSVLQSGTDHALQSTLTRIHASLKAGLDERSADPVLLKAVGHVAIATTHIEEMRMGCEPLHNAQDARVAVLEPEAVLLDPEIEFIARFRITHRCLRSSEEDPVAFDQSAGEFRHAANEGTKSASY